MQYGTRGNMSVTSRLRNIAFLGLLVSLCLLSALGFGIAEQIVDTDPHVVLEVGTRGILPCRIQRRGYSVEWKRQLSSGSELLVSLELLFDVGARDGPGFEALLFNITEDYSLVIKDVKVQDEGLYICSFSDYQTGMTFRNSTKVSVQAFPDEPFPVIQECIGKDENSKSAICPLTINSTSNLTCFVMGYYPDIDLFFLHGSEKVTPIEYEERRNADGTKIKEIRVQISVSDEPYQCVASRLPGMVGNRSITVTVQAHPQAHNQGPSAAAIVIPVVVMVVRICLFIFCYTGRVQQSEKEEIDVNEMKGICLQISKRHLEHLLKALLDIHEQEVPHQINRFVEENIVSLFNIHQMLHDWVQNEECSSYDKRKKLQEAVNATLQRNHEDDKWPPDNELSVIASFLSPASMEQLCSKLEIESPPEEASQEERLEALTEWRDKHASSENLKEKHTVLFNAFKGIGQKGMIPRAKGQFVYKAELVDLAFYLFAQDLLPFTETLGISAAKLNTYKPTFHPSHMTQGTIGLVCQLFHKVLDKETEQRCSFVDLLNKMPYPNVSARGMLALEISYGELCAISSGSDGCQEGPSMSPSNRDTPRSPGHRHHSEGNSYLLDETISSEANPATSLIETKGDAACTYDECVQKQSHYEINNDTTSGLTTLLESICEIADHNHTSLESLSALKNFRVWRDQPRLTPFNFHLAIAKGFGNMNMDQQASAILQGDYTACKIPFTFLHEIILRMDPDKLRSLGKLVEEAGFSPALAKVLKNPQQDLSRLKGAVWENLRIWMEQWIKKMKSEESVLPAAKIAREHKEFNDKLVEHGFMDLAREIMISEQ